MLLERICVGDLLQRRWQTVLWLPKICLKKQIG